MIPSWSIPLFSVGRAASDELGEELVRMLVRVRRHIPRRS